MRLAEDKIAQRGESRQVIDLVTALISPLGLLVTAADISLDGREPPPDYFRSRLYWLLACRR